MGEDTSASRERHRRRPRLPKAQAGAAEAGRGSGFGREEGRPGLLSHQGGVERDESGKSVEGF